MPEIPTHGPEWIDDAEYHRIQTLIPIVCIDVLPVRMAGTQVAEVGLIFRPTPQGQRWCTVGGRLRHGETFAEAIRRELLGALGPDIRFDLPADPRPQYVQPYYTVPQATGGYDSRKHSIGLSWAVPITGTVRPDGEALHFEWFAPGQLPGPDKFGFQQDRLIAPLLAALEHGRS